MKTIVTLTIIGLAIFASETQAEAIKTGIKVIATPVVVIRDVVDIPLTGLTNFFRSMAMRGKGRTGQGQANTGYGRGGVGLGVSVDVSYPIGMVFSGCGYVVDGLLCRTFYPNWPNGVSPFKSPYTDWTDHLFPNTKAVWSKKNT